MICFRNALLTGALVALAFSAVACDKQRRTPGIAQDQQPASAYPSVAVEAALQRFIAVDYTAIVVDHASDTRPMKVTVPLRSTADNQMSVQYEFSWFDEAGRQLGRSGWQFVALEPRFQRRVTANSLASQARAWRLEVRSAR